ncbi:MAG: hypothetical protein ACFFED_16670 [Candidatus Thorarchaeota archaeon]
MLNYKAICPYCKDELRVEMTAQFVERVDPSVLNMYSEELDRMQKRAASQGGMMKMAAGMAKGMQGTMVRMMQGMVEFPPMITILKCMNCDAALSVALPSKD